MTTAYSEEESATPSQGNEPLVWPIVTPAELAVSARPPDPKINFANLLIALFATLELVFMIVHTRCRPSIARKLGRSTLGRRLGLASKLSSNLSSSGTQFLSPAAAQQAEVSRKLVDAMLPTSSDHGVYIETSVQRLLRELKRQQLHYQPQDFERTTRKVTA